MGKTLLKQIKNNMINHHDDLIEDENKAVVQEINQTILELNEMIEFIKNKNANETNKKKPDSHYIKINQAIINKSKVQLKQLEASKEGIEWVKIDFSENNPEYLLEEHQPKTSKLDADIPIDKESKKGHVKLNQLEHQDLLIKWVASQKDIVSYQTEKELKAENPHEKGYHDLLVHYDNKSMIVELERTRKTKQIFEDKLDIYY